MEGVCGLERRIRIKAEDLVEQDGLYLYVTIICMFSYLYIGLIPSQSKTSVKRGREVRIGRSVGQEWATLNGKHVKRQTGFDAVQVKYQRVVQLSANNPRLRFRFLVARAKTINKLWVGDELEADLVDLVLRVGCRWQNQHARLSQQTGNQDHAPLAN